ncbi:fluoride efflux transporter CrcB [Actinomycetospora sp. TBRC 11914]|nr:fluoride efflux transporter CrcB [Actinomycetospora sp. TBRC 11914]
MPVPLTRAQGAAVSHAEEPEITDDVIAGREPGTAVLRGQGAAVAAVAVGGALGALARWGIGLAWPTPHGGFPTATLLINVVGCLLMGVLVVHVAEVREAHPLVRPFLGVGVLGGFTTFSTFAVDSQQLLLSHHLGTAFGYLAATVLGSVGAAALGLALARATTRGGRR